MIDILRPPLSTLPFSNHQLGELRAVVRALVKERQATYVQIAQQLEVDYETLKAFSLGRSKRPKGPFLRNLAANIRRIGPFADGSESQRHTFARILMEISGSEFNRTWYDEFYRFFSVSRDAVFEQGQEIVGRYVLYRNTGNGRTINKTRLDVLPFDENTGVQEFLIVRRLISQRDRISKGIIIPMKHKFCFIGKIGENEGLLSIFAEKQKEDANLFGIMLSLNDAEGVFATRIAMIKTTARQRAVDTTLGAIDSDQLKKEIGQYAETLNNSLDDWATMRIAVV